MSETITVKTSDFVNVSVTTPHDDVSCILEKRFNKGLTVAETKIHDCLWFTLNYYYKRLNNILSRQPNLQNTFLHSVFLDYSDIKMPPKKKRNVLSYSHEELLKALEAMKNGESASSVSKRFDKYGSAELFASGTVNARTPLCPKCFAGEFFVCPPSCRPRPLSKVAPSPSLMPTYVNNRIVVYS